MADTIIQQDPQNANRGTVRGRGMVERSLQQYGAGRSVLVDRNGVIIAGNKTAEIAQELGIPVTVIESDGTTLYAIKRTDLDLATDDAAKALGVADNRASETGLEWDPSVLQSFIDDGLDLEQFWFPQELAQSLAATDEPFDPMVEWEGMPEFEQEDQRPVKQIVINFASEADLERFARLVEQNVMMTTKSIWYPRRERITPREFAYASEDTE